VGGSSQFLGTKEAGVITVDGGTVSTRVFPIYNGLNAADPVNEVDGIAGTNNAAGDVTITSSATPTPTNGTRVLLYNKNTASGFQENAGVVLTGVLSGQNVTVTFDYNEVTGNAFSVTLPAALGWATSPAFNTAAGGWQVGTLTATATVDNPEMRIVMISTANLNDKLAIDNIVITVN
jgi:hypothetical protein